MNKPNVLFIIVEDLRADPWFGPDQALMKNVAPNIQRLAQRGSSFDYAYAQVSVCAPSRTSLLTGLRPDTLGIFDFSHYGGTRFFRTITSHFHRSGYQTSSSGKLQHWDSYRYYSGEYWGLPEWDAVHRTEHRWENASVTPDSVHNDPLDFFRDSFVLKQAVASMKKMHAQGSPWFQAVGFKGTHMPYHMPKRFHDKWARAEFDVKEQALSFPADAPLLAHVRKTEQVLITFMTANATTKSTDKEFYQSTGAVGGGRTISRRGFTELYRGYLACLSYVDHMLGLLLDVMDEKQLWDSTVVVFTSDHGMHVAEKGIWGKWTLFEESTHVPLVIVAPPPLAPLRGARVEQPVELIDLFPTLVELSGTTAEFARPCAQLADPIGGGDNTTETRVYSIPRGGPRRAVPGEGPVYNTEGHVFRHVYCDPLDGSSLAPLLFPGSGSGRRPFPFALTQKMTCKLPPERGKDHTDLDPNTPPWTDFCPNKREPRNPPYGAMGYAMRISGWKYVAWLRFDTHSFLPSLDRAPLAEQLYEMSPRLGLGLGLGLGGVSGELQNLAGLSQHAARQSALRRRLYDFLFHNASFSHLYHRRLDERAKNHALISGRLQGHPRDQYSQHFYQHLW